MMPIVRFDDHEGLVAEIRAALAAELAEPLFTVWIQTEGLELSPILCTAGTRATRFVEQLVDARICHTAQLVPCCRSTGTGCSRDQWPDEDHEHELAVLMIAAQARGISWPADRGHHEGDPS